MATQSPTSTPYDLLNRYLHAVAQHLWPRQSEDVVAEIAANLTAEIEDRESALARPLRPEEIAAILKRHGPPVQVGGRYLPQQALIGPYWLPMYWYVLKIVLSLAWLVYAVVNAVALAVAPAWSWGSAAGVLLGPSRVLVWAFAWVTLVFAALEWTATRGRGWAARLDEWDPLKLPKLEHTRSWPASWRNAGELLPGALMVAYWVAAVPGRPLLTFGPAAAFLRYTPAVAHLFWPVLALLLAELALDALAMGYGPEAWQRRAKGAASKTIALGIFLLLMRAGDLIMGPPEFEAAVHAANAGIRIGLRVAAILAILMLVADLARLAIILQRRRPA